MPDARWLAAWTTAAAVLLPAFAAPLGGQQDVFRAAVTMVPIDVRAFDRNRRPVTDLALEEFEVLEDGVPQRIAHFSTQAFTPSGPVERRATVDPVPSATGAQSAPSARASLDTARVTLTPANGRHIGSVEVAVFTLDVWQRVELDLSEATYQKFKAGGIPYTATLPAPPDIRAVKIVVYDYAADLVGSLVLSVR